MRELGIFDFDERVFCVGESSCGQINGQSECALLNEDGIFEFGQSVDYGFWRLCETIGSNESIRDVN